MITADEELQYTIPPQWTMNEIDHAVALDLYSEDPKFEPRQGHRQP
jgi:hypothetical protein